MSSARRIWIPAARPKTLPAAVAPVLMGTAVAWRQGSFHALAALAALCGALLIQIGTNFANDYFDYLKGADTEGRLGPQRLTQAGLVAPATMRNAYLLTFGLSAVCGAYLVARAGWPIAVIGLLAVIFGILYTGGPQPLGYLGIGDPLVLLFFGPVAVAGTHYVQALHWSPVAAVAGIGVGLLSMGLLVVNNLRDIESDREAGKRTLPVRLGSGFAKAEFICCVLGAALVPMALLLLFDAPPGTLAASATCLLALPASRAVVGWEPGDRLLEALFGMGRTLAVYAVAFSAGWVLS